MRVQVFNPPVDAPKSSYDEYWTVVYMAEEANGMSSQNYLVISEMDFNPELVQIDVNSATLPGFAALFAQTGDKLSSVTGILTFSFGSYEVLAAEPFFVTSGRLPQASTTLTKNTMILLIATKIILNLDPSDNMFTSFGNIAINKLNSPDIIALQEVQGNDGAVNS